MRRLLILGGRALRGLALFALTLVCACLLVFLALDLLPGDAATQQLGLTATTEQIRQLAHAYGLDAPVLDRFVSWLFGAIHGDFGVVLASGRAVADAMAGPLSRTAAMFVLSLVGVAFLGVGAGLVAGLHGGTAVDKVVSCAALALRSVPEFIAGVALMFLLATTLHLLPAVSLIPVGASAFDAPQIFVLPIACIVIVGTSCVVRPVRAVVEGRNQSHAVEAARLAGLPEAHVVMHHVLPQCAAPIGQVLAGVVPYLVGGTVIVERVFNFPGIGSMMVAAVQAREPNVLMACALVMVATSLCAYWVADLLGERGVGDGHQA